MKIINLPEDVNELLSLGETSSVMFRGELFKVHVRPSTRSDYGLYFCRPPTTEELARLTDEEIMEMGHGAPPHTAVIYMRYPEESKVKPGTTVGYALYNAREWVDFITNDPDSIIVGF